MRLERWTAAWLDAGWPAWAGVAALVAAALLAGVLAPQWRAEADERLAQLARPAPRPAPAHRADAPVPPAWPGVDAAPQRVARLLAVAQRHGVALPRMQQRLDPNGQLLLSTQARGSYAALRSFVEQALAADPALALDGLLLRRDSPAAAEVNADLQWTLVQRRAAVSR